MKKLCYALNIGLCIVGAWYIGWMLAVPVGKTIDLDCSVFESACYDPQTKGLTLVFQNGAQYQYHRVDRDLYVEFMRTPCKGHFFNDRIRSVYPWTRLDSSVAQCRYFRNQQQPQKEKSNE